MSLSPLCFFPSVKASLICLFGCSSRLTINNSSGWFRFLSFDDSCYLPEFVMDFFKRSIPLPLSKLPVYRAHRWKIFREHSPLDSSFRDVEDGIHYFTDIDRSVSATSFCRWNQWADDLPFLIRHIRGI